MDTQLTVTNLIDLSLGLTEMGSKRSGHWKHRGRPGKRGGSAKGGAAPIRKSPPTNSTFGEGIVEGPSIRTVEKATRNLPQEHLDTVASIRYERLGSFTSAQCFPDGSIELSESGGVKTGDLIHEIGHAVLFHDKRYGIILDPNKHDRVFRRIYKEKAQAAGYKFGKELETAYTKGKIKRKVRGFPSGYSMSNPHELFAESYELFVRSPKSLQRRAPEIYNYMRDNVFNGIEYTE